MIKLWRFAAMCAAICVASISYAGTSTERAVPDGAVDLGLSVCWATCNVGASHPEEYGRYFAWGDVAGQTWNGSSWSKGGFPKYPSYELDDDGNLKPEYDAAHVLLGGAWRMPTQVEFRELIENCTCVRTDNYNGTGIAGRIFISKKPGFTDKSIFLPAAGSSGCDCLDGAGVNGFYWSSTFDFSSEACYFYFRSDNVYTDSYYYGFGQSVRPVTE